jgi:hypothetical protein
MEYTFLSCLVEVCVKFYALSYSENMKVISSSLYVFSNWDWTSSLGFLNVEMMRAKKEQ